MENIVKHMHRCTVSFSNKL